METSAPKGRLIGYWAATALVSLLFGVTGGALLVHLPHFTQDMERLGYPAYFLAILGTWKILGAAAILAPRLPRLKEWAYAGMILDVTSAAISRTVRHDGTLKIIVPLLVACLVFVSWRLRPVGRTLKS